MKNPADSPCPNCGASREGLRNATHDFIDDCPACRGPGRTGYADEYKNALDLALKVRAEKHAEVAASVLLSALREARKIWEKSVVDKNDKYFAELFGELYKIKRLAAQPSECTCPDPTFTGNRSCRCPIHGSDVHRQPSEDTAK